MAVPRSVHRRRWLYPVALLVIVACGSGSPSPRTSPSLPSMTDNPVAASPTRPTRPTRPPTAAPTIRPTGSWPSGWDTDFCAAFSEVVVAQELAVDVGRALDDDAEDDALALANELNGTSAKAAAMLGELHEWKPAQKLVRRLASLTDLGERMGRSYRRFIEDDREPALERAQGFGADMGPIVDAALVELDELAERENLRCPGQEFALESP